MRQEKFVIYAPRLLRPRRTGSVAAAAHDNVVLPFDGQIIPGYMQCFFTYLLTVHNLLQNLTHPNLVLHTVHFFVD